MPKMAASGPEAAKGELFDLHSHTFMQPNPQATLEHGGVETMPNACNNCHTGYGESPEWAAQTIAYAKTQRSPDPSSFWGPGPTPTSPPPPTPIPSVGRPVELVREETGQWLRTTFFAVVWTLGLAVLLWIGWYIRAVRMRNA
jgi:hypothetical protein